MKRTRSFLVDQIQWKTFTRAEAFMIFKVAPEKLRKANEPLFNWFSKGGFI
jgi:hypothetical protein